MAHRIFSEEIRNIFYSVYNNDKDNLKFVPVKLLEKGLSYIDMLTLTTQELKITLGEAIMLLEIPDYIG